jgi:phosphoglycolate phosphatase
VYLVLFDIDGTLLHGQGVGRRAMERAGRALLSEGFTLDGIDFAGALDPWIFAEAAARVGVADASARHDEFRAAYIVELERELQRGDIRPRVLPGVADLLSVLRTRSDVTLGLVTGNYRRAAPMKIAAVGIDPELFVLGAFGDDATTRPELVALALDRWTAAGGKAEPERVLVVGDTPRDVECAHANGCRCLAVATGWHTEEALVAARADFVARDLTNPAVLLDLLVYPSGAQLPPQ